MGIASFYSTRSGGHTSGHTRAYSPIVDRGGYVEAHTFPRSKYWSRVEGRQPDRSRGDQVRVWPSWAAFRSLNILFARLKDLTHACARALSGQAKTEISISKATCMTATRICSDIHVHAYPFSNQCNYSANITINSAGVVDYYLLAHYLSLAIDQKGSDIAVPHDSQSEGELQLWR